MWRIDYGAGGEVGRVRSSPAFCKASNHGAHTPWARGAVGRGVRDAMKSAWNHGSRAVLLVKTKLGGGSPAGPRPPAKPWILLH